MNIIKSKIQWIFWIMFTACVSCNKPNNNSTPSPPQVSGEKIINSFGFKSSNNPGLMADVNGIISTDSIMLSLPADASLKSLIPSIIFKGKSIEPQNNVAQDFSSPIAYTVTAEDGSIKKYIVIATVQPSPATIFWNTSYSSASLNPADLGYVYALDANTGKLRWKYSPASYSFKATPAFADGILYISNYHKVIALDTTTKATKWEFGLSNTIYAAIAVVNNVVYFNCNDGKLYAVDAKTGKMVWKFSQDNDDPYNTDPLSCRSAPTVVNGTVYFGNSRSKYIYALDAKSGSLKWKTFNTLPSAGAFQSGPSVVNGIVYIGDVSQNVIALDANNGNIKWSFAANAGFGSSPTVVNGVVYIAVFNYLYALDAANGTLKWKFAAQFEIDGSPTVVNGTAYFGGGGGNGSVLYAVDVTTGTEKWRYSHYGLTDVEDPIVFNDLVYFSIDYDFIALDIKTGKLKWKFSANDGREGGFSPCIVDIKGNVYYPAESGLQQ